MWLAVLSAWTSLLTLVAGQSCSEDSTTWVRLKPLGQCGDGDISCPYRIVIPPLTIQLPKPYREMEKMVQELQDLTQLVNRLKDDCQACKERPRLQWNLQTGDAGNRERIQASRGTLNTRDRPQDLYRRVTPAKSTEMRRPMSVGQAMEKHRSTNLEPNVDPGITRLHQETGKGLEQELNLNRNERITGGMSDVRAQPSFTADDREDPNSHLDLEQRGEQPAQHETHNYPAGTLIDQDIPGIGAVTVVSEYDSETQPDNIYKEKQHAQIDRTGPTILDTLRDKKEVSDHVHDARHKDLNPLNIYVNVAKEESPSVVLQPILNNKYRTEKSNLSNSHTESGPLQHDIDARTGIREKLNAVGDISRSSSKTVDVRLTNHQKPYKTPERLLNPDTGVVTDPGIDSNPIKIAGSDKTSTSQSNTAVINKANDTTNRDQIPSQIMRVHLQNPFESDTDVESDSAIDPSPLNTSKTGTEQITSVLHSNQKVLQSITEDPINPNTEAEIAIETDPRPNHRVTTDSESEMSRLPIFDRTGVVDLEASGMTHPSGIVPGNNPARNKTQPGGLIPENNPSVNQNLSGIPKRIMMSHPRETRPVKMPAANLNFRGKYNPSGLLPLRPHSVQQNATGVTRPGGLLTIKTSVKQKPSPILQPSGQVPLRFEAESSIAKPNYNAESEKTNASRFVVANTSKQRKPYFRQRLQGNTRLRVQNISRHISVHATTLTPSNSKATEHQTGLSVETHKARHEVTATADAFHLKANQKGGNVSGNTETEEVFVRKQQNPNSNREKEQVTNGVRENSIEADIKKNTAGHDSYNNTGRDAQPPVEEEIKDTHSGVENPQFQANNNENKNVLGEERRQKIPPNNEQMKMNKKDTKMTPNVTAPYFIHQNTGGSEKTNSAVNLSDNLSNTNLESEPESSAEKRFNDSNLGNKEFDPMLHNASNVRSGIQDRTRDPIVGVKVRVGDNTRINVSTPPMGSVTQNRITDITETKVSGPSLENISVPTEANDQSVTNTAQHLRDMNHVFTDRINGSKDAKGPDPSSEGPSDSEAAVMSTINVEESKRRDVLQSSSGHHIQDRKRNPNLVDSTRANASTPFMTRMTQESQNSNKVIDITEVKVSKPSLENTTIQNKAKDPNLISEIMDSTGTKVLTPSIINTAQNVRDSNPVVTDQLSDSTGTKGSDPSSGNATRQVFERRRKIPLNNEEIKMNKFTDNARGTKPSVINSINAETPFRTHTTTTNRAEDPKIVLEWIVNNTRSTMSTSSSAKTNIQDGVVHPKSSIVDEIKTNTSVPSTNESSLQNQESDPDFMDSVKESKGLTPSSAIIPDDTAYTNLPGVESFEDKHGGRLRIYPVSEREKPPQDCSDFTTRNSGSGVYRVTPNTTTFPVFCDMTSSGGGWTLIQHRFNGSVSFNRNWDDYKKGFGSLSGEFWLGNDKIHMLTAARVMVLRVELEDLDGMKKYAQYERFYVANETQHYRLTIGDFSGNAGNAMQYSKKFNHNQKNFTTPDRDNDQYSAGNCGAFYNSGWWFDACISANLNGKYYKTRYKGIRNGIFWGTWHNISTESYPTNERQAFKTVRMMIKPRTGDM